MMLPNKENAHIDIRKLKDYCLNEFHPVGKHKAYLFKKLIDFTEKDAEKLKKIILDEISKNDATEGESDEYGKRYFLDFYLYTNQLQVKIRTSWIIKCNEDIPRLTSCYIKEG